MGRTSRIKVKGVRKTEDVEMLSLVLWLQAKRLLRERRANEQAAREMAKRQEHEAQSTKRREQQR
jgi:topoisomerase IA-like protein